MVPPWLPHVCIVIVNILWAKSYVERDSHGSFAFSDRVNLRIVEKPEHPYPRQKLYWLHR